VRVNYESVINRLLHWLESPVRLTLTDPAHREWKGFQRHVETLMAEGGSLDKLHDWGGKLPGAALRIAGLLAASSSERTLSEKIQRDEVERATALCTALIPHAIAAFNLANEDPIVTLAKRILSWLRTQEGPVTTKRNCFRAMHSRFDQIADMGEPLQVLANHSYIRVLSQKTGGRPSEVIEINPHWKRDEDAS
jgi:putative DNA primase/helicase